MLLKKKQTNERNENIILFGIIFDMEEKTGWNDRRMIVNCHIETIGKLLSDGNQFTHKATGEKQTPETKN